MSRLAKKPIIIPEKIEIAVAGDVLTVKGPIATLSRRFPESIGLKIENGFITVSALSDSLKDNMLLGTTVSHLKNMIQGAAIPFVKKLIIEGIGFKAEVKSARPDESAHSGGQELVLSLGFSHPVKMAIPSGLKVTSEKGVITVSGSDIEAVGIFAARVRDLRKPEPYKGKGIRYENEAIRRKQGKKTA